MQQVEFNIRKNVLGNENENIYAQDSTIIFLQLLEFKEFIKIRETSTDMTVKVLDVWKPIINSCWFCSDKTNYL